MYISIIHLFSKTLWGGGGKNNPVRSSIRDQCHFYAEYDKNASTRACFFLISQGEQEPISRVEPGV